MRLSAREREEGLTGGGKGLHLKAQCRDDPKRCNQIKIMPFIRTCFAQSESARPKANTLYTYSVSLFDVACLIIRWGGGRGCGEWTRETPPSKGGGRGDTLKKRLTGYICRVCRCLMLPACSRDGNDKAMHGAYKRRPEA
jgi:hypothetical protein